jgi:membrane protease YdiL (CAAX protease family)
MVIKMEFLKKAKVKNWLIFLGILFLFLYLDYFIIALYYTFGNDLKNLSMLDKIIILFSKYIILIVLFIIIDHKYLKEKWFDFIKHFKKYSIIAFKNWFAGFIIMIISNLIISHFISGIGQNETSVQTLITKLPVIALILTTVTAPFVEEMVFRKYLQHCVDSKVLYMILSGVIFGYIHTAIDTNILELLLIIPYGALGFMFAKTINETDNIYTTIMVHMFHNGALTLLAIWGL